MYFEILSKILPSRLTENELYEFCERYKERENYDQYYKVLVKNLNQRKEEIEDGAT
mgnify:CR=1 FL=1